MTITTGKLFEDDFVERNAMLVSLTLQELETLKSSILRMEVTDEERIRGVLFVDCKEAQMRTELEAALLAKHPIKG